MQQKNQQQENHLPEITRLLSMYHALSLPQLGRLYPELTEGKLLRLLGRLEKTGRLALLPERGLVLYSKDCIPSPSRFPLSRSCRLPAHRLRMSGITPSTTFLINSSSSGTAVSSAATSRSGT